MNTRIRSLVALIVSTTTCLLVGVSGSLVTMSSLREWYPFIQKPSWTPPDALFGPVWSALYLMMGVSVWLVWSDSASGGRRKELGVFVLQLTLNALWSFLFFGLRNPGLAAFEIVLLWVAIVATMVVFARRNRLAAWLLLPYLLWVSFATALNVTIWRLNG
jgi:tryptophan-rich sensory protein